MNATAPRTCPLTGNLSVPYASKGRGQYFRDPQSGVIFLAEPPSLEAMATFVNEEYTRGVYRDYVDAKPLKLATARRRLRRLAAFSPGPRLLDVGCAAGFFIEAALEAGFDASGIELSPVAVGLADAAVRPRIVQGDVNTLIARDTRRFDVVTAFDIIEHTFDPREFVADVGRVLAPGGLLVISTPDTGHWLRVAMGARWPMLQPDQHTFLFSRGAMRSMLSAAGFTPLVIETAHKVLTLDYLFGQLRQTNPMLARTLDVAKRAVPRGLRQRPLAFNIGEMLACARKA
ncbi:MAG: class I SAM-dependent methyltransferase [Acidobacteria bacterium]|nr:class I SAM-dependent methyltransferase [Acidobacteriota bacterium]